jgi:hypothetical protein
MTKVVALTSRELVSGAEKTALGNYCKAGLSCSGAAQIMRMTSNIYLAPQVVRHYTQAIQYAEFSNGTSVPAEGIWDYYRPSLLNSTHLASTQISANSLAVPTAHPTKTSLQEYKVSTGNYLFNEPTAWKYRNRNKKESVANNIIRLVRPTTIHILSVESAQVRVPG